MESILEKTSAGCQHISDRGLNSVQAMKVEHDNQSVQTNAYLPVYSNITRMEKSPSYLLQLFNSLKKSILKFYHLGDVRIDEQRLTTRDPRVETFRFRKDF